MHGGMYFLIDNFIMYNPKITESHVWSYLCLNALELL